MGKRKRSPSTKGAVYQQDKGRQRQNSISSVSSQERIYGIDTYMCEAPGKTSTKPEQVLTFPMTSHNQPLPDCEGPKMPPFSHQPVNVRFLRELGDNAMHSNVFEVEIQKESYALKLFKTFDEGFFPDAVEWGGQELMPNPSHAAKYFRPFDRECRAYGRIRERGAEDRFWKCYGYVRLPADMRKDLYDVTGVPAHYWQARPLFGGEREDKPSCTLPWELNWPIYGLVKELAPDGVSSIDPKSRSVRAMLTDLKRLHKMDIINGDIADRNYLAGRIIDFSSSYTLPHIWFEVPKSHYIGIWPPTFQNSVHMDHDNLITTIQESGIKTRTIPSGLYGRNHSGRTRSARAKIFRASGKQRPFYELGVVEPPRSPPPRPASYQYS